MTEQSHYDRYTGPRDRRLRVGDAEREAVSEILRREHVRGRLDADEFQERLDRAFAAKTYADLDALVADLPSEHPPRRPRATASRSPLRPRWIVPLALIALIFATGGHLLWLAVPLFALFVLRPLVWRSWGRGYRGFGGC